MIIITKQVWNIKVTVRPSVTGAPGTMPKRLVKGLEDKKLKGQIETIQSISLLRSTRILRRILET